MTIGRILKKAAPPSVRNYVANIQNRLERLERLETRVNGLLDTVGKLESTIDTITQFPRYQASDIAGFNAQLRRKEIFREVIATLRFGAIVETGTWTGDTTGYMAEVSRLPVFSGELNYRFHTIAKMRLVDLPGITLRNMDSRNFITELAQEPAMTERNTFFYLDAHWYNDLPLAEEIDLIASHWKQFVIMIDDFQVPGDDGYGYDDYGPGNALTPEYIAPLLARFQLASWYPRASSSEETGAQRGCVVIARSGDASVLDETRTLRRPN
jgi:hypothetical protein